MWHEGAIGIPRKDGTSKLAKYWVEAAEKGSRFGINGGKIDRLIIEISGKRTAEYNYGWNIEPDEADEPTQIAYCILLMEYN